MGVSVDDLPSGRAWERETSLFLRDLFVDKIFREWGLVTRATNALRMLRQRKLAVFGFAAVALTAFLLLSILGYRAMKDTKADIGFAPVKAGRLRTNGCRS
jgi:type VI protein secretion system component VasK